MECYNCNRNYDPDDIGACDECGEPMCDECKAKNSICNECIRDLNADPETEREQLEWSTLTTAQRNK
jgi:hypothetical protein